jgi:hypothetical protein
MNAPAWLTLIEKGVRAALPGVEISRPDDDLLTLSLGTRSAVLHVVGDVAILAPSFAAGGTIGSRLQDRVQHLEMTSYALTPEAGSVAVSLAVGHLSLARRN